MTDFHMHVLPGMDDGSKSTEISLRMLAQSAVYGVDTVAATSHFYAEDNSLRRFLRRRAAAHGRLMEAAAGRRDLPRVLLGAEVRYFSGVSVIDDLEALCLQGTDLLLLEMPFTTWTNRMLREVENIGQRGLIPVAAHIERYLAFQPRKTMDAFFDLNVLIQCNASFFLSRRTAHKALSMFRRGQIQFLGSDAHNLDSRPPNLGGALKYIEKKAGKESLDRFIADGEYLIASGRERIR